MADRHTAIPGKPALADLGDVEIEVVVELGRRRMTLREARTLAAGEVITIDRLAGEAVQVRLNGHPFAEGETVSANEILCARLTHLLPPPEARDEDQTGETS